MARPPRTGAAAGRCCLHIGLPKTATKTLQMGLFARHSQVDFLGTYTGMHREHRQCRDKDVERLIAEILWDNWRAPDLAIGRALADKVVKPSIERGLVPVWSWESLMENRPEVQRKRAENLKAVFGTCKVLLTLRHPVRLVESLYLQLLKRDNIGMRARLGRKPVYLPIDQWLEENWNTVGDAPRAQLEYADSVDIYADVFGRENVLILLFERLVKDADGYFAEVCRFVGVDPAEGVEHTRGQRENQRWTQPQLDRLKAVGSSAVLSTLFRIAPRKARRTMLGFPRNRASESEAEAPPARVTVPAAWQERIKEKTRAGNQRLVREWELPLEAFNYPL